MKINIEKYEIARARTCTGMKELIDAGIRKGTLCRISSGRNAKPETIGRIAAALGVDVTEIIDTGEK